MTRRASVVAFAAVVVVVGVGRVALAGGGSAADQARVTLEQRAAHTVRTTRSLAPIAGATNTVHDPFNSEDCGSCHASADKENPGAVVDATNAMCLKCHDDPGLDGKVAFAHQHGGPDARCTDCHNPHNSKQEHLLHAPIASLCGSCHVDKVNGAVLHAPIKDKPESCTACHQPHGAGEPHLLSAKFPSTFYAPYTRDAYALCFSCHDKKLVEERRTTTATKFRDGDENLHSIHVMRDDKGRTCGACHDLHTGARANLVHDSVDFGSHGWRLPIGFTSTETGGGCAKTCHVERSYDRNRARVPWSPKD